MDCFHTLFQELYEVQLVDEGSEPIYLPKSSKRDLNHIVFAHGFWNSALHEIAHWCVAGTERRNQVDYGYWYQPDGRSPETQASGSAFHLKRGHGFIHTNVRIDLDFGAVGRLIPTFP